MKIEYFSDSTGQYYLASKRDKNTGRLVLVEGTTRLNAALGLIGLLDIQFNH